MYEIDLNLPKQIVADVLSNHEIHSVAFVGCGASMSDLYPAKYFLANNTDKLNVQIFTANEFNYDTPSWVNEHTFVITCSLGGSTPETVEANKTAKKHNCPVVSLTNKAGSALTVDADHVIVHGFHANFAAKAEKPGYAIALALEILQQTEGYDKYEDMITGLTNVFDLCENAAQSCKKLAKKFAEDFKDDEMIYFMASGASEKMAYSHAAFLFTEMQWIDAAAYNTGEYFHGPFEVSTEGKPYVFFMSDGATRPMDARALTFLQRMGAKVALIDSKDYGLADAVPATVVEPLGIDQHAIHIKQHCLDHTHLLSRAKRGWGANPIPSQSTRKVYLLVISRKASTCSDAWSAGADGPRRSGCRTRA